MIDPKLHSRILTEGPSRTAARSYLRGVCLGFAFGIALLCGSPLFAQASHPIAPLPSQLRAAHTLFLANAGSTENVDSANAYYGVYLALAANNRYHLTETPAEAELSLEVSLDNQMSSVSNGNSYTHTVLRLVIRDTKTHSLIWTLFEPVVGEGSNQKTLDKNLDAAVSRIVDDLNSLAPTGDQANKLPQASQSSPAQPTKTRF
jgi:hypothetical protein